MSTQGHLSAAYPAGKARLSLGRTSKNNNVCRLDRRQDLSWHGYYHVDFGCGFPNG